MQETVHKNSLKGAQKFRDIFEKMKTFLQENDPQTTPFPSM